MHQLGGAVHAERTVVMERHNRRGIQERQARASALGKGRELLADGIGELQLVSDIKIALANVLE